MNSVVFAAGPLEGGTSALGRGPEEARPECDVEEVAAEAEPEEDDWAVMIWP